MYSNTPKSISLSDLFYFWYDSFVAQCVQRWQVITVFGNGMIDHAGHRVVLNKRTANTYDRVLALVGKLIPLQGICIYVSMYAHDVECRVHSHPCCSVGMHMCAPCVGGVRKLYTLPECHLVTGLDELFGHSDFIAVGTASLNKRRLPRLAPGACLHFCWVAFMHCMCIHSMLYAMLHVVTKEMTLSVAAFFACMRTYTLQSIAICK